MEAQATGQALERRASPGESRLVHVAIIMDGNGRWARQRGLPRIRGHQQGAERLREIVEECPGFGIRYLTVFAFSTENWKRSTAEVDGLMSLFRIYARSEAEALVRNGVRFRFIGDHARLDAPLMEKIRNLEQSTRFGTRLELSVAVNYGARSELVRAVRKLAQEAADGKLQPDDICAESINSHLYTSHLPDPDLIIRTSGEYRLSNFMLWQSAYSEFEFVDTLWPEFDVEMFRSALAGFARRKRRFGAAHE